MRLLTPAQNSHETELLQDGLWTIAKASEFLGFSKTKLYDLMQAGKLKYVKIGRARRIPRRAIIELAAAGLRGGWNIEE